MSGAAGVAQAFIALRAEDPEAATALAVARTNLADGASLTALRRERLVEITGARGDVASIARTLHGSIQFYNPAKERCILRAPGDSPPPFGAEEACVCVIERGGDRRAAAERWWRHETGERVTVREATVWVLAVGEGADALACAQSLATARDRTHGLFANPHVQDVRVAPGGDVPLPWIAAPRRRRNA